MTFLDLKPVTLADRICCSLPLTVFRPITLGYNINLEAYIFQTIMLSKEKNCVTGVLNEITRQL